MPPSVNNAYVNTESGRTKAQCYRTYEDTVLWWSVQNSHELNRLRDWIITIPPQHAIRLDKIYHFLPHKILTKALEPRRNDTSNRVKILEDVIAKLLGIDDCYFWCGYHDKAPITIEGLPECVDINFSLVDLKRVRSFESDDL